MLLNLVFFNFLSVFPKPKNRFRRKYLNPDGYWRDYEPWCAQPSLVTSLMS